MPASEFVFEAEFALLDVGATGAFLRSQRVRPTLIAFHSDASVESVVLEWDPSDGSERAFEEARKWLRSRHPVAYALVAMVARDDPAGGVLSGGEPATTGAYLAIAMFEASGDARGVLYPYRSDPSGISFGKPAGTDAETTDWCPIGDIWVNPFCVGDVVRFKPRERAIDPTSPLWKSVVELTKMRIHQDELRSPDYMAFLDDARNGIFIVAGRPRPESRLVMLKPRTMYNPIGFLTAEAPRLQLVDPQPPATIGNGAS